MPGFLFPGRPGGEHDEPLLDMIIARRAIPPDAPQPMHDLARMLAALAGPAESGELAGEAAVRAAFSRAASPVGISAAARRPGRRRRPRFRPVNSFPSGLARRRSWRWPGWAASSRPTSTSCQPHSATGARHGGGAGAAQLRPAPVWHGRHAAGHARRSPAQQPVRPRAAPLDEPGAGPRAADPDADLQARPDPVTRPPGNRAVLRPGPDAPVRSRRRRGNRPAALAVPGRTLHRHPDRAVGRAHAEPVRALNRDLRRLTDDPSGMYQDGVPLLRVNARIVAARPVDLVGVERDGTGWTASSMESRTREGAMAELPELP